MGIFLCRRSFTVMKADKKNWKYFFKIIFDISAGQTSRGSYKKKYTIIFSME